MNVRRATLASIGAAIAIGGTLTGVTPAFAAFNKSSCDVALTQCKTANIPAHSTQHWVHVDVLASAVCSAGWRVVDASNDAVVASGTVGRNGTVSQTIYGLYGSYHLTVFNTCFDSTGIITNYT
jgi:hypothetical protein